jgi:8-oxo-dGTP pyrophosphatase MutT (NUDIX family)
LLRFFQAQRAYFQDDFKATLLHVFSPRHLFMKQITPQSPSTRWKPSVTVAAIIEKDGKFLLIEEHTPEGLRLNNPAGHLDPGESPIQACSREALEESAHDFKPTGLIGIYLSRFQRNDSVNSIAEDVTYLRFAFSGELGAFHPLQPLDKGIVRTLWLSPDEIRASVHLHRSPLLLQCMKDYLQGQRYGLELIYTDPSVYL